MKELSLISNGGAFFVLRIFELGMGACANCLSYCECGAWEKNIYIFIMLR